MPDPVFPTAFSFRVSFQTQGITGASGDSSFQEVHGLTQTIPTMDLPEGGQNQYVQRLPQVPTYSDLVLTRGVVTNSQLIVWLQNAFDQFQFTPATLVISLLDSSGSPMVSWRVVGAIPTKWSVNNFGGKANELALETLELKYQYFVRTST
jgi:phage tail-like protein